MNSNLRYKRDGAREGTRTFTGEPPLEPESSASTNSATSAHGLVRTGVIMHSGGGLATIFLHMKENIFQGLFPPGNRDGMETI